MTVRISSEAAAAIRAEAVAAHPHECCGLLLGAVADAIDRAVPARNVAADPASTFEIDPAALIAAERAARGGGPMLLGYYHSHPNGRAEPSARDRADAAADGRVWIIAAGEALTAWRAVDAGGATAFEPVELVAVSP